MSGEAWRDDIVKGVEEAHLDDDTYDDDELDDDQYQYEEPTASWQQKKPTRPWDIIVADMYGRDEEDDDQDEAFHAQQGTTTNKEEEEEEPVSLMDFASAASKKSQQQQKQQQQRQQSSSNSNNNNNNNNNNNKKKHPHHSAATRKTAKSGKKEADAEDAENSRPHIIYQEEFSTPTAPSTDTSVDKYTVSLDEVTFEHNTKDCMKMNWDIVQPLRVEQITLNDKWTGLALQLRSSFIYWRLGRGYQIPEHQKPRYEQFLATPKYSRSVTEARRADITSNDSFTIKNLQLPGSARAYQASVVIGTSIVLFGGNDGKSDFNDLVVFDTARSEWRHYNEIDGVDITPPPLSHHQMVKLKDGDLLIVSSTMKHQRLVPYILHNPLNEDKMHWGILVDPQNIYSSYKDCLHHPNFCSHISYRTDFSLTSVDGNVYLFGGKIGQNGCNELFLLTKNHNALEIAATKLTPKWTHRQQGTPNRQEFKTWATPRYGHSAIAIGPELWIYGGHGNGATFLNDLFVFDSRTQTWREITIDGWGLPPPLAFHGMICADNRDIIIHGGLHSTRHSQSNIYRYRIGTSQWHILRPRGRGQSTLGMSSQDLRVPMHGHQIFELGAKALVIGGMSGSTTRDNNPVLQLEPLSDEGSPSMLAVHLQDAREKQLFCDVHFRLRKGSSGNAADQIGGDTIVVIPAHKCIVAVRCDYLGSLLEDRSLLLKQSDNEQSPSLSTTPQQLIEVQIVDIGDCSAEIFTAYLDFLYCGTLQLKGRENIQALVNVLRKWKSRHLDTIVQICCRPVALWLDSSADVQQQQQQDLRKLVHSQAHCDILIKPRSDSDEVIPTHRVLLVRSPYLRSMLLSGMRESTQSLIEFDDMNFDGIREVLSFLYTDDPHITPANCISVFVYSHMFGLRELSASCRDIAIQHINIFNVIQVLELSDIYGDPTLKRLCVRFMAQHYTEIKLVDQYPTLDQATKDQIDQAHKLIIQKEQRQISKQRL